MPPAIEKIEPSEQAPHVAAEAVINGMLTGMARPKKVDKWWGYELHYRNDSMYCMKLLHFDKGGATSMHFHVGKHETLLVVNGILTVATKYDKKLKYRRLEPGQALVVAPGFVHRLIAAEGPVDLVEASTYDHDDDSVRVA
jgi:mannose-6-phosphate isomerase-like protein (cupin superfamily)